jgi:hypothetical protein
MPHLWQTTEKCSNGSSKIEATLNYKLQPNKQNQAFVSKVTASEKAQEASYLVTELTTQKRKSNTVRTS